MTTAWPKTLSAAFVAQRQKAIFDQSPLRSQQLAPSGPASNEQLRPETLRIPRHKQISAHVREDHAKNAEHVFIVPRTLREIPPPIQKTTYDIP
jgi:hypothetical protein